MQEKTLSIINKRGLHARASAKLADLANSFACKISLSNSNSRADAKNILQLMMLAAAQGSQLQLQCDGSDEALALSAIEQLFADYFDEGE